MKLEVALVWLEILQDLQEVRCRMRGLAHLLETPLLEKERAVSVVKLTLKLAALEEAKEQAKKTIDQVEEGCIHLEVKARDSESVNEQSR